MEAESVMNQTMVKKDGLAVRAGYFLLLFLSLAMMLFGVGDIINAMDNDVSIAESILGTPWATFQAESPAAAHLIDLQTRGGGNHMIVVSILSLAILWFAFRKGERWSWYVMWVWLLWPVLVFVISFTAERQPGWPAPVPMMSSIGFVALAIVAQLLTRPKFFPRL